MIAITGEGDNKLRQQHYRVKPLQFLPALWMALTLVALPLKVNAQAIFDGQTLYLPNVVIGDERLQVELNLIPDSDPIRFEIGSAVESSMPSGLHVSTFENDTLTISSVELNGEDSWLRLRTVSVEPPVLEFLEMAVNDFDDDDDGRADEFDAFPYDPEETDDTDSDGIGDNSDLDDDNDGVADADDDLPKVAAYSKFLTLTDEFVAGTYLQESSLEPVGTDTSNEIDLGRYQFLEDGALLIEFPEGTQSGNWEVVDNSLRLTLQEGLGVDFNGQGATLEDLLAKYFLLTPVEGQSSYDVNLKLKSREFRLVEVSNGVATYWVVGRADVSILNDELNLAWFGSANPDPVEITFESSVKLRAQPELPAEAFTAQELTSANWVLPLQLGEIGPNRLSYQYTGPLYLSLADDAINLSDSLVSFDSNGTGISLISGEAFSWALNSDGSLRVIPGNAESEILLQKTKTLEYGIEVIATATRSGSSYYRKSLAMPQDVEIELNSLVDQYLVKNSVLWNPDNIGSDSRINFNDANRSYVAFWAFKLNAEQSGIRHLTSSSFGRLSNIIYPYEWELEGSTATLWRKNTGSCVVSESGCVRERRVWQLLKSNNGRLYMLEVTDYPNSDSGIYELGDSRDIEYYELYEPSEAENAYLSENLLDLSAR
jgi:hypothetical protein